MALYENNIQLKGFVGKDAESKTTAAGNQFTVFSLATKSSYKDKQSGDCVSRTEWHRIVAFGKTDEFAKVLKKGDYVEVTGELRSSTYEAETSGDSKQSKRRSWETRAGVVRKLERPGDSPVAGDAA